MAGDLGEHWLGIADLARMIGEPKKAEEIETQLLAQDMLPVSRIPELLNAIEASQGKTVADELALRASAYTDYPAILQRALRLAREKKDNDAVRVLNQRLKDVSGKHPESL